MPEIKYNLTNINYTWRGSNPSWIVIHNTANETSAPPIAYNNTQYFKNEYRGASANYFIDDSDVIWCCVEPINTAWHCGEAPSQNGCYNYNSIGIEVCEPANGKFTDKEISNLSWLVQKLMKEYKIPASRICRHYDVTSKNCPWYYTNNARWNELKERICGDMLSKEDANTIWAFDNWGDQKGANPGTAWRNLMDTNRRIQTVEKSVTELNKKIDQIIKKLDA